MFTLILSILTKYTQFGECIPISDEKQVRRLFTLFSPPNFIQAQLAFCSVAPPLRAEPSSLAPATPDSPGFAPTSRHPIPLFSVISLPPFLRLECWLLKAWSWACSLFPLTCSLPQQLTHSLVPCHPQADDHTFALHPDLSSELQAHGSSSC